MLEGQCLCGVITVRVPEVKVFEACHCGMCRRWGGGPFLAIHVPEIEITGEAFLQRFPSSAWAERAFCRQCGTHIFYKLLLTGEYDLPVGLFSADLDVSLTEEVFIDRKPAYYEFANETIKLTEAETIAKYTAE